jgi:predicted dienelactone hydrolase
MSYDPFRRGEHPVGVRTVQLEDAARGRRLVAEVWYPSTAAHAGADLDPERRDRYPLFPGFPEAYQTAVRDAAPAAGRLPLAIFSHGYAGHRRQSTFFATHLASHGWAVASVDHTGNTFMDLALQASAGTAGDAWSRSMEARPLDVSFLIDAAADGRLGLADVDTARVGMSGHSFGGWTSVRAVADEPRIASVVALAPAIGVPVLRAAIDLAWKRPVPVLIIAADRDSLLPLAGIEATLAELPAPATLVTLVSTDHMHFCDAARQIHELFRTMPMQLVPVATPLPPFETLAPARNGHDAAAGLGLAHLDATIRHLPDAAALIASDLSGVLAARDIAATTRTR